MPVGYPRVLISGSGSFGFLKSRKVRVRVVSGLRDCEKFGFGSLRVGENGSGSGRVFGFG